MTKKGKKKNNYFTHVHEQAIIKYSITEDNKIRSELYILYIGPAFNELVDKIVYTYKFTTLPNIDSLRDECKIWLTTILNKYDPSTGSKAFSYFSVITKNWFIHKVKKNKRNLQKEVHFDDLDIREEHTYLTTYNKYEEEREKFEFWKSLWTEIEDWEKLKLKENERKVLAAIKILLSSADEIEIFNKKAIYLYMREITGLNTKQIVNNLNKLRERYRNFKKSWTEDNL